MPHVSFRARIGCSSPSSSITSMSLPLNLAAWVPLASVNCRPRASTRISELRGPPHALVHDEDLVLVAADHLVLQLDDQVDRPRAAVGAPDQVHAEHLHVRRTAPAELLDLLCLRRVGPVKVGRNRGHLAGAAVRPVRARPAPAARPGRDAPRGPSGTSARSRCTTTATGSCARGPGQRPPAVRGRRPGPPPGDRVQAAGPQAARRVRRAAAPHGRTTCPTAWSARWPPGRPPPGRPVRPPAAAQRVARPPPAGGPVAGPSTGARTRFRSGPWSAASRPASGTWATAWRRPSRGRRRPVATRSTCSAARSAAGNKGVRNEPRHPTPDRPPDGFRRGSKERQGCFPKAANRGR